MRIQMQSAAELGNSGLRYSHLLAGEHEPGPDVTCFQLELINAHDGCYKALCRCAADAGAYQRERQGAALRCRAAPCRLRPRTLARSAGPHSVEATLRSLPSPAEAATASLTSWPEYCTWRGLTLSSPAPVALSAAVTLWHGLAAVLPQAGPEGLPLARSLPDRIADGTLHVLVAGADVEVPLRHTFLELFVLWPHLQQLQLTFAGPDVPTQLHGRSEMHRSSNGRIAHMHFKHGFVHNCDGDASSPSASSTEAVPDIALLGNAGLAAYASWTPTLLYLKQCQV